MPSKSTVASFLASSSQALILALAVLTPGMSCASPSAPPAPPAPSSPAKPIDIPNAATPMPGMVTGGPPNEAQLRAARAAGYRTVVSLLPEADTLDEAKVAREIGLRFVSIPVRGAVDLTEENARKLAAVVDAPDAPPMIVHCASGNRVGALLALKAVYVDGQSAAEALALGERAGLRALRPVVEAKLSEPRAPQ